MKKTFLALVLIGVALSAISCKKDGASFSKNPKSISFSVTEASPFKTKSADEKTVRIADEKTIQATTPVNASEESPLFLTVSEEPLYLSAPEVKGAVATGESIRTLYKEFTVNAFVAGHQEKLIDNGKVSYNGGKWVLSPDEQGEPYKYPSDGSDVIFWSYAPSYDQDAFSVTSYSDGCMSFDYAFEKFGEEDHNPYTKDLIFAHNIQKSGEVKIAFEHALAAVSVVAGTLPEGYAIEEVGFEGIFTRGSCVYDPQEEAGKHFLWSGSLSDPDGTGQMSYAYYRSGVGNGDDQLSTSNYHFAIPQILSDEAYLHVRFAKEGEEDKDYSFSLSASEWKAGYRYVYRLSYDPVTYTFELTQPNDVPYSGGSSKYTVKSWKTSESGQKTAVDFSISGFSTDDGQSWSEQIPSFMALGNGTIGMNTPYEAIVFAQSYTVEQDINDVLSQATPVQGTYDLSTCGGTTKRNTANCYIVSAPGTYSLPLVYGNSIVNGSTNSASYSGGLVDYLDRTIKSPYICNNSDYSIGDCCLVWQDEDGIVENVRLSISAEKLLFDVPQANIKQGNAVVAVRDDQGRIIWSWHIWITHYNYEDHQRVIENLSGQEYTVMGRLLGQCDAAVHDYAKREVLVKYTQEGSGLEAIARITQAPAQMLENSNMCFYNCGRKDPIIGSSYSDARVDKTQYSDREDYKAQYQNAQFSSYGQCIQNPQIIPYGDSMRWVSNLSSSFWGQTTGGYRTKRIYDPCPVGYTVPTTSTFTGFTYNGQYSQGFSDKTNAPSSNTTTVSNTNCWAMYCKKMNGIGQWDTSAGVYYIPAISTRSWSTGKIYPAPTSRYWVDSFGNFFTISTSQVQASSSLGGELCGVYPVVDVFLHVEPSDSEIEAGPVDVEEIDDQGTTDIEF